jgi:hypothetical protein
MPTKGTKAATAKENEYCAKEHRKLRHKARRISQPMVIRTVGGAIEAERRFAVHSMPRVIFVCSIGNRGGALYLRCFPGN